MAEQSSAAPCSPQLVRSNSGNLGISQGFGRLFANCVVGMWDIPWGLMSRSDPCLLLEKLFSQWLGHMKLVVSVHVLVMLWSFPKCWCHAVKFIGSLKCTYCCVCWGVCGSSRIAWSLTFAWLGTWRDGMGRWLYSPWELLEVQWEPGRSLSPVGVLAVSGELLVQPWAWRPRAKCALLLLPRVSAKVPPHSWCCSRHSRL